ncbi:hypothetical protein BgiMline_033325 [Biomphalaria glabrata]
MSLWGVAPELTCLCGEWHQSTYVFVGSGTRAHMSLGSGTRAHMSLWGVAPEHTCLWGVAPGHTDHVP